VKLTFWGEADGKLKMAFEREIISTLCEETLV
jgi:hypothetical protein